MIRFLCPRCDSSLSAPHRKVGAVCSCPKCRMPLQVPGTPDQADTETGSSVDVFGRDRGRGVLIALRWVAWAACVAWVGALAWPYLNSIHWEEFPSLESWSVAGACPLMLGGYVLACAIDRLSRW